jgi:hypothetical protein
LVRLGVAEDVDDVAMFRSAVRVYHVSQRVGLDGRYRVLTRRLPSRLLVHHGLQSKVFGVGLALDIGGDAFLHMLDMLRGDASGSIRKSDGLEWRLVPEPGK